MNNIFIYRDRRLRGLALLRGLFTFYAICALGTVANVGIAGYVFAHTRSGGWPALPESPSDRYGTTRSRRFSRGSQK
jgi:hypothetical protein